MNRAKLSALQLFNLLSLLGMITVNVLANTLPIAGEGDG